MVSTQGLKLLNGMNKEYLSQRAWIMCAVTLQVLTMIDNVLKCRWCGSEHVGVWDSRRKDGSMVRRRKCFDCNKRWMTIEVDYWDWLQKAGDEDTELL